MGWQRARTTQQAGELVHDDWIVFAALENVDLTAAGPALVVKGKDPTEEIDKGF